MGDLDHLAKVPHLFDATFLVEGMTCNSCVGAITRALKENAWVRSADVSLISHSAEVVFEGGEPESRAKELINMIEAVGYGASVDRLQPHNAKKPEMHNAPTDAWHATYNLHGMTCSSCVGHITRAVQALDFINKVEISLLSHIASVIFLGRDNVSAISQAIEDAGYGAALESITPIRPSSGQDSLRTVSIPISGLGWVTLGTAPSLSDPVLTISYIPDAPRNTIRSILSTVTNVDPSFEADTYHPPTLEERSRQMMASEQRHILYRVVMSIIVAIPALIIGIVYMNLVPSDDPGYKYLMARIGGVSRAEWANFIMATPVYFFAADLFHRRTIKELRALWRPGSKVPISRRFYRFGSMNMLISFGTSIAYFASIAELIIASTRDEDAHMMGAGTPKSYFDSVVFLTMFLLIGRLIEAFMKAKAGNAVAALSKLKSTEALLVSVDSVTGNTTTTKTPADLIEVGDIVRIPNGSSPPYDGNVIVGESDFDESVLTGESMPVTKSIGDTVYSGTVNKVSPISIRVTGAAGKSVLDSIINVVREGLAKRAPVERFADLITGYFVPIVVLLAIFTWLIWMTLGEAGVLPPDYRDSDVGGWPFWSLQFAIAVFVIACPCGLGLAAPTALFVGGGLAAKRGILVKGGGEAFQEASNLDAVVFDKTGTLTEGAEPKVVQHKIFHVAAGLDKPTILGMLKSVEENSSPPLARAAVSFSLSEGVTAVEVSTIDEVAGKGLKATSQPAHSESQTQYEVLVGNEALLQDYSVAIPQDSVDLLESWKASGNSVMLLACRVSGEKWGLGAIFAASDPLRAEAAEVVSSLQARGVDVWMLSGDNPKTANAVGSHVGILPDNIIAGVLPTQKADKVRYLQQTLRPKRGGGFQNALTNKRSRATVAMVGDGINDAPALAAADVGIAVASGSDVAVQSAAFVLVQSDLRAVLTLVTLSRAVFRRVILNFFWAALYNMVALPVAAGVLYPIQTGGGSHVRLDPAWAALAMALSSISVVASSLLLRTRIPGAGFRE